MNLRKAHEVEEDKAHNRGPCLEGALVDVRLMEIGLQEDKGKTE